MTKLINWFKCHILNKHIYELSDCEYVVSAFVYKDTPYDAKQPISKCLYCDKIKIDYDVTQFKPSINEIIKSLGIDKNVGGYRVD
jgi:hypothetical protein